MESRLRRASCEKGEPANILLQWHREDGTWDFRTLLVLEGMERRETLERHLWTKIDRTG